MKILNYKGNELFLCTWLEKPCFMASQIGEVLRTSGRSITESIRNNSNFKMNEDYCVIKGNDAKDFRNQIKISGKDRFFISSVILFRSGMEKYLSNMKYSPISNEIRDLSIFLSKEKIIDVIFEAQNKNNSIYQEQKKDVYSELPEYKQKLMIELYECIKETPIPSEVRAKFIIDILENRMSDSIGILKKWMQDLKVYAS